MLKGCRERTHEILIFSFRFLDGAKFDMDIVVLQVRSHEHGMIALFLGLNFKPVGKAIKALIRVKIGKVKVEVGRVKFQCDLFVDEFCGFLV